MNNDHKKQQKEREVLSEHQFYLPNNIGNISSFSEYVKETSKQAGRFKSPHSQTDRLLTNMRQKIAELAGFDNLYSFQNSGYLVPSQWQEIFNYLHDEGIITSPQVHFESFFHDEPKLYSLRLFSTPLSDLTDGKVPTAGYSRGVSDDFEEALSKVIGELLERYPLTIYRKKDFIRSSYRVLKEKKRNPLDIFDLAGFADWQKELFPNRRFDDKSEFSWAEGVELLSGKQALIPAQLIFWNYNFEQEPVEPFLRQPITNGAAGHFTREEAILAGVYESIQRDAFLIHWLNKIAPPQISIDTVRNERLRTMINRLQRYGFEVVFLNTTLDLEVPSCVCVFIDKSGKGPKVGMGGGCGYDLVHAMMRSITEATGVYHWLRTYDKSFSLPVDYKPFRTRGIGHESRLFFWGNPDSFSKFEWLLSGPSQSFEVAACVYPTSFQNSVEELGHLKKVFRKFGKGYEIYVYEAQHKILESLGYHSVRTVVPALLPLYLEEVSAPLWARRLREVPQKMGYQRAHEPYPWPHPFP